MKVNINLIGCIIIALLVVLSNILILKILSRKSKGKTLLDVYTSKGKIQQSNNVKYIIPLVLLFVIIAITTIVYIQY